MRTADLEYYNIFILCIFHLFIFVFHSIFLFTAVHGEIRVACNAKCVYAYVCNLCVLF